MVRFHQIMGLYLKTSIGRHIPMWGVKLHHWWHITLKPITTHGLHNSSNYRMKSYLKKQKLSLAGGEGVRVSASLNWIMWVHPSEHVWRLKVIYLYVLTHSCVFEQRIRRHTEAMSNQLLTKAKICFITYVYIFIYT